jgi:hypothetical protein
MFVFAVLSCFKSDSPFFAPYLRLDCLELLCYFTRKPDEQPHFSRVFPHLFMQIALILLMVQEECLSETVFLFPVPSWRWKGFTKSR